MRVTTLTRCALTLIACCSTACTAVFGMDELSGPTAAADAAVDDSGAADTLGDDAATDVTTADTLTGDTPAAVTPPSCAGGLICNGESCCTSPLVTGGAFKRSYDGVTSGYTDGKFVATIADFRLDKYEVTVGRFRKFVAAAVGGYKPTQGAGKHTHLPAGGLNAGAEPGWDVAWNGNLSTEQATWNTSLTCSGSYQTWTAANENLPINCVNWYQAAAFCIWDGGFLPSEAEWNHAAAGGSDQRILPWGSAAVATNTDLAIYGCYYAATGTCTGAANIAAVGSAPAGNGRWGHADLGGNVFEWTLDLYKSPYNEESCIDCAFTAGGTDRVRRGGAFNGTPADLIVSKRSNAAPADRALAGGLRCARAP